METSHSGDHAAPTMARFRQPMEKAAQCLQSGLHNISWHRLTLMSLLGAAIYGVATHPPIQPVANGEVGLRINQ